MASAYGWVTILLYCLWLNEHIYYLKHIHPAGLLQHLPIPEWKWEVVTMDFITKLPRTAKYHNFIMVVVDKITKAAHFISSEVDAKSS